MFRFIDNYHPESSSRENGLYWLKVESFLDFKHLLAVALYFIYFLRLLKEMSGGNVKWSSKSNQVSVHIFPGCLIDI